MRRRLIAGALDRNLAEAFFERGVRNYIGAGWPVDDTAAVAFATTFYEQFLAGTTLAESLALARERAMEHPGSTWGAYQHYGWADECLPPAAQAKAESEKEAESGGRREDGGERSAWFAPRAVTRQSRRSTPHFARYPAWPGAYAISTATCATALQPIGTPVVPTLWWPRVESRYAAPPRRGS